MINILSPRFWRHLNSVDPDEVLARAAEMVGALQRLEDHMERPSATLTARLATQSHPASH